MSKPTAQSLKTDEAWRWYRHLADASIDVVLEADAETNIRWVSPSVTDVLGWDPAELVRMSAADLVHPDDMPAVGDLVVLLNTTAGHVQTTRCRIRTRAGSYRSMQLRGRAVTDPDGTVTGHVISLQDTTERDSTMRALATLTEAGRVLTRATDESSLHQQMCQAIVGAGGYAFAWYGTPVADTDRTVRPVARAGAHDSYLDAVKVSWGNSPQGQGPTGMTLRTGTTTVRNDFDDDPAYTPWRGLAQSEGFRSSISLPVLVDGHIEGALMVYATETHAFDVQAQQLLEDLVADLGLGIERLRALADVSAERERLADSERRYRLLAENASDMVWQVDPAGAITWTSESVTRVLGWQVDEVIGRVSMDLIDPADRTRALTSRDESLTGRTTYGEYRVLCADGASRWMGFTIRPYPTGDGMSRVDALRDIQDEVMTRGELAFAIEHDQVTGLPTRQAALARIEAMLDGLPDGQTAGLLCIGVDSLATVNDALTYAAGDVVLAAVADRLVDLAEDPDLVGRGIGDEFLVLLPQLRDAADAAILSDRIRLAIKEPVTTLGRQVLPTVSIGIAVGSHETEPLRLVGDASLALRQAKDRGRDRFEFVDANLAFQSQVRLSLEADIRRALADDEFVAWFQPIASMHDGTVVGYEALVRWARGDQIVAPAEFLPVAERSALIHDIDVAVLRQALAHLAALPGRIFVSVNASSWSLGHADYADDVERALATTGADPTRLHLEVTETALLSVTDAVRSTMTRLAALGVRWYVDDFGTGYSSISHLRDLPVAGLKLDLSFTRGIGEGDVTSVRLAQGLVGLAEGLELDTVAEGVETEFEASILHSQGWRNGQGWLYGRPAPLPD